MSFSFGKVRSFEDRGANWPPPPRPPNPHPHKTKRGKAAPAQSGTHPTPPPPPPQPPRHPVRPPPAHNGKPQLWLVTPNGLWVHQVFQFHRALGEQCLVWQAALRPSPPGRDPGPQKKRAGIGGEILGGESLSILFSHRSLQKPAVFPGFGCFLERRIPERMGKLPVERCAVSDATGKCAFCLGASGCTWH